MLFRKFCVSYSNENLNWCFRFRLVVLVYKRGKIGIDLPPTNHNGGAKSVNCFPPLGFLNKIELRVFQSHNPTNTKTYKASTDFCLHKFLNISCR